MEIGTSTIKIVESNFKKGEITVREIKKKDPLIRGYYYKNYFTELTWLN